MSIAEAKQQRISPESYHFKILLQSFILTLQRLNQGTGRVGVGLLKRKYDGWADVMQQAARQVDFFQSGWWGGLSALSLEAKVSISSSLSDISAVTHPESPPQARGRTEEDCRAMWTSSGAMIKLSFTILPDRTLCFCSSLNGYRSCTFRTFPFYSIDAHQAVK